MKKYKLKKLNKKGFSLVQLMLILMIISIFSTIKLTNIKAENENIKSENTAIQMKNIANATNSYINLHYNKLSNLSNDKSIGLTCNSSNSICNINIQSLVDSNLLPAGSKDHSLLGSDYKIVLKRTGNLPNYNIKGVIYIDDTTKDKNKENYNKIMINKIVSNIGADGGLSHNGKIVGLGGSWSEPLSFYNIPNRDDILAINVGYDSSMYSTFLRRDGVLPMTGNLNLGGNDVSEIKDVNVIDTMKGESLTNSLAKIKDLESDKITSNRLTTNGSNIFNGGTTLNGSYFTINTNSSIKNGVDIKGFLGAKSVEIKGDAKFNNSILASKSTVEVGKVNVMNNIQNKKISQLDGNIVMGKNNTVNISNGNVSMTNKAQGNLLTPKSVAVEGSACTIKGAVAQDVTGSYVSCVSGKWSASKGDTQFYKTSNRRCSTPNKVTNNCSCSSGYSAIAVNSVTTSHCSGGGNNETCSDTTTVSYICQ